MDLRRARASRDVVIVTRDRIRMDEALIVVRVIDGRTAIAARQAAVVDRTSRDSAAVRALARLAVARKDRSGAAQVVGRWPVLATVLHAVADKVAMVVEVWGKALGAVVRGALGRDRKWPVVVGPE